VGLIDRIRSGDYVPDGAPVAAAGRARSLHDQAERIRAGEDALDVVRDALDQLGQASDPELDAAVAT
jgi:outer membrane protein assembly factor BamD (BamD/ComL family)